MEQYFKILKENNFYLKLYTEQNYMSKERVE